MKHLSPFFLIALLFAGCASPKHSFYSTLGTTQVLVNSVMDEYAAHVRAGKLTEAEQEQVREVYDRYYLIFETAVLQAKRDYSAMTPAVLAEVADELLTLLYKLEVIQPVEINR